MRVVLVRAGALGDLLLLRRAVFALRRAGHRIALLAPATAAGPLLGESLGQVQEILDWGRRDVAALLAGEPTQGLRDALAECGRVVAYTRSPDLLRALAVLPTAVVGHDPHPPEQSHAADWLADPVRDLVRSIPALPPNLDPGAEAAELARPWLERLAPGFLAVHPGSGSPAKNWPTDRFRALIERLSPDRPFLLVEGPADGQACRELAVVPGAVAARGLTLPTLGAVLALAGLYVGNDSGVSHLAAAVGAPALVLFGPTSARTWRPIGGAVRTVSSTDGTLAGLDLEAVYLTACEPGWRSPGRAA